MKLPCTMDIFSTHSDSDESSNKREDSAKRKSHQASQDKFDIKSLLDQCCQHRAAEFGKKHWEEEVRVRRKIILTRRRHMILF